MSDVSLSSDNVWQNCPGAQSRIIKMCHSQNIFFFPPPTRLYWKSQDLRIIALEKAHHSILTFLCLSHFPSNSLSPKERLDSSRLLAAPLLKEYTVKLSAINTTKLQALYKMPISVLEQMAIDWCWDELIWMLLHFVSVSGFTEAGRTVGIITKKNGEIETLHDTPLMHLFYQHRPQCLFFLKKLPLEVRSLFFNSINCKRLD